jgi:hypothetical protein
MSNENDDAYKEAEQVRERAFEAVGNDAAALLNSAS